MLLQLSSNLKLEFEDEEIKVFLNGIEDLVEESRKAGFKKRMNPEFLGLIKGINESFSDGED